MATELTSTTFLSDYNDDYRDSDHYHRILFNSGRALQARELTQSQTIIQGELGRLAQFIVNEGAIFNNNGNLASGPNAFAYTYVKVNSLPTGYASLVNTTINDGDLSATVKAIIPATGGDPDTIMVKMTSGQAGGSTPGADTAQVKLFTAGSTLSTDLGNITVQSVSDAVGRGSVVQVPAFDTYAGGHLVSVEAQTLVIDKYDPKPSTVIGFVLSEQIITTADNIALYDNSGSTPNLTSPGADRLKITLTLTKEEDVPAGKTFYEVYKIVNGIATLIKTPDKVLSRLGDIVANRTQSITGNFIEYGGSGKGNFGVAVYKDSADDDYLTLRVDGGVAFISGHRIERDAIPPRRIQKPRSEANFITTETNVFGNARYGNYFLADSAKGLLGYMNDYTEVVLWNALGSSGDSVGNARIRHIDEFDNDYRIHVFDVTLSDSYGLNDVRSIGIDSVNTADLKAVSGNFELFDRAGNTLLFDIGDRERINEISNVTTVVGKIFTDTTNADGDGTISTGNPSVTFADVEQWIVQVDSSGELLTEVSVSSGGSGSDAATIANLPATSAVTVLAYENATLTRKTKTLKPSASTWEEESGLSLTNNEFTLSKVDIYKFNSVVDDDTGQDITYKFLFDNGQRDNFYQAGSGKLKSGATAPSGTVTVQYQYFQHSTPGSGSTGYFGGKASYPDVEYDKVPYYRASTGEVYSLNDVIDMRPIQNPSTGEYSGGISRIERLPRNGDTLTIGTLKSWNYRTDLVTLTQNGTVGYYVGTGSKSGGVDDVPVVSPTDMPLAKIILNPYTIDEYDLTISMYNNRGYKMSDIRKLDQRIGNVERISALTLTEMSLSALEVFDPETGTTLRQTQGVTGDGFRAYNQTYIDDPDNRSRIIRLGGEDNRLGPLTYVKAVGLTYDSDLSTGTVLKGNTIWPVYTEVVSVNQDKATRIENVNQFEIAQSIGSGVLIPEQDLWTERKKVSKSFNPASKTSLIDEGAILSTMADPEPK